VLNMICNKFSYYLLCVIVLCFAIYFIFPSPVIAKPQAPQEKEITIEEFLQQLSSVPFILSRRDPFSKVLPPFEASRSDSLLAMSASVLERYPLGDYQLVAILIGDIYSRALVKIPESGKIMIVREKDKLGNRGGVIKKITKTALLIEENKKNDAGFVDRTEVQLNLQGK